MKKTIIKHKCGHCDKKVSIIGNRRPKGRKFCPKCGRDMVTITIDSRSGS